MSSKYQDRHPWAERRPNPHRRNITKGLRRRVFKATRNRCWLCGRPMRIRVRGQNHPRLASIDHYVPRSRGGTNDPANLRGACRECNTRRGNRMPEEGVG